MDQHILFSILLLSPLVGFLINGFGFRRKNAILAGCIATAAIVISFICSILLVQSLPAGTGSSLNFRFFDWISVGELNVPFAFTIDSVSAIMILVVTGVGSLIHLFSIGYMSHDKTPAKYFCYLNLFIFNMLLLVLGNNLLLLFVGWEGVGLCSYLLIGYWYDDPEKAAAGMKAFITNRIGDVAFLLGTFVIFLHFGTIEFAGILSHLPTQPELGWTGPLTIACLLLFIGATGKSAQIPLYVWLPDAMAGPTPVSALIHAATMVTAGVYLIIKLAPMYLLAPNAMMVVACVGAATAVFAALIGLCQWDIKKVLAYSTVSQLGYMFLAVGVGAFGAALFHLMTHAFFKALMFLGSGSVIHAMHEEQDIRKMGGLKKKLPITHLTFFMGWLAIIGMPPFAGFFSKDEILWFSFASPNGHILLWLAGLIGAVLTAFYMTRLMALTFWGKSRVPTDVHPHESPPTMLIPLIVLGVLAVTGGWLGIPHVISEVLPGHVPNFLQHWLHPMVPEVKVAHGSVLMEWILMSISVCAAGVSATLAYWFYIAHPSVPAKIAEKLAPLHRAIENKFWVDEFYFAYIIDPLVNGAKGLWYYIDVNFIDKITYWISDLVEETAQLLRQVQSGNMQTYALYFVLGLAGMLLLVLR